ncbi:MAG: acyl-CoA dehydrogenase C-terminal domain-containing protein [Gammaproteobacteria bacterium]|nr:acyl-CoA dehydrogenase C-terminal domain-containing protein [Gammaproteobacteria bacterium]
MPSYTAPVRDTLFVLNEVLDIQRYAALRGYADATPDVVQAILEGAAKLAEEVLQPLNAVGDRLGCTRHPDGSVTTPPGFKGGFDEYVAGGWIGLSMDPEYGGQGLPHAISAAVEEYVISANMAFAMYPGLTQGAIAAITAVASEEQKRRFIPPMIEGRWMGTMNLTEPHCGTDLGLLRTRAEPQADGSYRITGTKIFISSGDHDLTENIIHLVLAKLPDSPDNVKGISLFIVPKVDVNEDGSLGAANAVSVGSIEEKMGIHGNATCVMNYDGATGYLIGEKDKGLRAMFIMMNAARLLVGMQGLAISEVAYQNALAYARERLQGRALTGPKNAAGKADPIIVHPDVRRMLMDVKAFNEGARALALWGALLVDLAEVAATPEERQEADDLVGLLTPVIKGFFTERGYLNATNAQQCLGGHGYIREWGLEQFVRDARISMIYEGTNGIQALDLVGRKLPMNGGRAYKAFCKLIVEFLNPLAAEPAFAEFFLPLQKALGDLQAATGWLARNGIVNPDNAGAGSMPYLQLMGLVSLGFMWAKIAKLAQEAIAADRDPDGFHATKLATARYYFSHVIVETATQRAKVEAGAAHVMALAAEAF